MSRIVFVLLLAALAAGCAETGKTGYLPAYMGTSGVPPGDLTINTRELGPYWW